MTHCPPVTDSRISTLPRTFFALPFTTAEQAKVTSSSRAFIRSTQVCPGCRGTPSLLLQLSKSAVLKPGVKLISGDTVSETGRVPTFRMEQAPGWLKPVHSGALAIVCAACAMPAPDVRHASAVRVVRSFIGPPRRDCVAVRGRQAPATATSPMRRAGRALLLQKPEHTRGGA